MTESPVVRAWLVEAGSGERVALEVQQHVDQRANITRGSRYQDYAPGAVTVAVDATELATRATDGRRRRAWTLHFEMRLAGVTRRGPLTEIDDRSSAGMIETGHLGPRTVGAARVGVSGRTAGLFEIVAEPWAGPELVAASVRGGEVRGTLRPGPDAISGIRLIAPVGPPLRGRVWSEGDLTAFSFEVPRNWTIDGSRERYALRVVAGAGKRGRRRLARERPAVADRRRGPGRPCPLGERRHRRDRCRRCAPRRGDDAHAGRDRGGRPVAR